MSSERISLTRTRFWLLVFQLFLSGGFPALKLDDAHSFVKEFPPFFRFTTQDLVNLALTDDGIALLTDTGVVEKLVDIFQATGRTVDPVLALAGTINPSRHRHLVIIR